MTIKQISVFVENQAGRLAEITEILGEANIDMRAMSIADTSEFGILRIIVDEPQKALEVLKSEGCVVSVTPVLAVEIEDTPGSLAKIVRVLADEGVSVEYMYAYITRKVKNAYVIFKVEDIEGAEKIFENNGIKTATEAEIHDTLI